MRNLFSSFVFLSVGLLAASAMADDKDDKAAKKGDGPYAEMREKIMKEFDKDGDGKLSEEEREAARGKIRELRVAAAMKQGDKPTKPAEKGARRDGRPGPRPGAGGPPGMPNPEEMFNKFDKDGDGKLSKDEFKAMAEFVHQHMPMPPGPGMMGRRGGPRAAARGAGGSKAKGATGAKGAKGAKTAKGRGKGDHRRSRDVAARARFRGPGGFGGDRFARGSMRRPGGPPFGGRFDMPFRDRMAMRGFGPGPRRERFEWRGMGPGRGGERFAMRGGSRHEGRGNDRDFRGPDRQRFVSARGPRDDDRPGHHGDGDRRGPRGDRPDFRGPGPDRISFAMRDGRPPRDGDDDGPRRGRRMGPPPGDGPPPREEGRMGRDREGPPGPPRDGEGRRFGRPDDPPPGEGPERGERAGRRGEGRPDRDGDRPGPPRDGDRPGRDFRPDGPPPGGPDARPEGRRGEGPRGERGVDREERRGPPRDRENDRRPPRPDRDGDGKDKGDKDKAEEAAV